MTGKGLWAEVEARLGYQVDSATRDLLARLTAYHDGDDEPSDFIDDLVYYAQEVRSRDERLATAESWGSAPEDRPSPRRRHRKPSIPAANVLGEYETESAEAYSAYLAAQAEQHPDVQYVRRLKRGESDAPDFSVTAPGADAPLQERLPWEAPDASGLVAWELCREYPWRYNQAIRFMLDGDIPWVSPAVCIVKSNSLIKIEADSHVSAEMVGRVFANAQQRLFGNRRSNRRLDRRTLSLYSFAQREKREGFFSLWRDTMERWNAAHPEEKPFERPEDCSHAFARASRFLASRHDWHRATDEGADADEESFEESFEEADLSLQSCLFEVEERTE